MENKEITLADYVVDKLANEGKELKVRLAQTEFTDVPSVISGLGIANSQAPFCNVTFDSVTKTGFGRYIIWTLPTISGYVIPSGSVVSATFTGRWK